MGTDRPTLLAFDTSAAHCAAAVIRDGMVTREALEPMARGQAERLIPLLEETLSAEGLTWKDLDAIGVGVGPGNFTGIRISVSAARGLALGLAIPAIGVSTFELLLDRHASCAEPALILSLSAPREQAYVQHFSHGIAQSPPRMIDPAAPPADLHLPAKMRVVGFRADQIAAPFHAAWDFAAPEDIPGRLAKAAARKAATGGPMDRPKPLYVRAPDAAPAKDTGPKIIPA